VVISRSRIARRVGELARRISSDYRGRELTVLAVMDGAVVFLGDLIRKLGVPTRVELAHVSSYPGRSTRSRGVGRCAMPPGLAGRHVLVVDDILDTGRTLAAVSAALRRRRVASQRLCVLLRKRRAAAGDVRADYVGFDIGDEFVVGYGLDYDNRFRNLPDVRVLASCGG
jgi:hypoxanthine phosphoribosyltransferase